MFETPILFLIFNRPEETKLVFEQIRKVKPKYLYVAADGPRKEKEGDLELCNHTRKIIEAIDWDCELNKLYRDENLGSGIGIIEAINWFFEHEVYGNILEDDCLPKQSFFPFIKVMLEKYQHNERIMLVSSSKPNSSN